MPSAPLPPASCLRQAKAVFLVGPTMATLGLSVQIPIAAAAEALLGTPAWTRDGRTVGLTLLGTSMILAGFIGVHRAVAPDEHLGAPGGADGDHDDDGGDALRPYGRPRGGRGGGGGVGGGAPGGVQGWLQQLGSALTGGSSSAARQYRPLEVNGH